MSCLGIQVCTDNSRWSNTSLRTAGRPKYSPRPKVAYEKYNKNQFFISWLPPDVVV